MDENVFLYFSPHPPLRAPSPTRGEGPYNYSVDFIDEVSFIAFNFIQCLKPRGLPHGNLLTFNFIGF